jgi:hypothetical protein
MKFKVSFAEMYPRIPWELTVPKGSAEHTLGTTDLVNFGCIISSETSLTMCSKNSIDSVHVM